VTGVLLLPSPLLPRLVHVAFLHALGEALWSARRRECSVDVARFPYPPVQATAVLDAFRHRVDEVAPDLVLTHSNGGRYAALAAPGVPAVHVDASLPAESGEPAPMASEDMLDHLAERADEDGLLPPWSRWWPEEAVAEVLPDEAAHRWLREHERRLPIAYFRSRLGAPPGWTDGPQAHVAFGGTYADEQALAGRHGWPVTRLEGAGHLHHLVAPHVVAEAVVGLWEAI
jgi:hypothetical protein